MSMKDSRTKKISEVLSNKTCKQILDLISDKDYTESEIASRLNIPLNTVEYNLKKLIEVNLIEKSNHWWSIKGKKMPSYKISNKYIIISPKPISKLKSFIPVILLSGLAGLVIKILSKSSNQIYHEYTPKMVSASNFAGNIQANSSTDWLWFLGGCLFTLIIYIIFNYKYLKSQKSSEIIFDDCQNFDNKQRKILKGGYEHE